MDNTFYLGLAVSELTKKLMCETCQDALQPYLGQQNSQYHYTDADLFVLRLISK